MAATRSLLLAPRYLLVLYWRKQVLCPSINCLGSSLLCLVKTWDFRLYSDVRTIVCLIQMTMLTALPP